MTTTTTSSAPTAEQGAANLTSDVRSAKDAIERGDWLDAGMAISNVAMDVISIAGDPLGAAAGAGFGWIIEHISFLREPFDALLGDVNSITGSAQGWMKAGQEITAVAERYREAARTETCGWSGPASDYYRSASATQAQGLDALAQVSQGIGQAIQGAGQLLAEVRKTVLDFINKCVQKVIMIIIEALAAAWLSFGASIAQGIVRSVAEAVQTAQKIISKIQTFISSLQKIMQTVQKIVNLAKAVKQLLETIGGRANRTQGANTTQPAAIDTTGIDAAANRRYSQATAPAGNYTQTTHRDYSYDQYRPGTSTTQPNYPQTAPLTPSRYQAPTGGGTGGPSYPTTAAPGTPSPVPSFGPSGPPPDQGAPSSRVDRARWIGDAVEILINHGVEPSKIDADQIARIVDRASGGNPHAMDMQDPNAANGFPPKGMMQITDPVFQQHQLPGHPNIWAPVDNMLAGVMHFLAQWGSLMEAMNSFGPPTAPRS
ncbi:hypothetical protein [Actinokineospora sp.]|uniref:hypothetical protein n=1 Tax=Actinokineospora sp. TaxID=1872133 RepID=UPI003D6BCCC0